MRVTKISDDDCDIRIQLSTDPSKHVPQVIAEIHLTALRGSCAKVDGAGQGTQSENASQNGAPWSKRVGKAADGKVSKTRVIHSRDRRNGLDDEAAASKWPFEPGTKDGKPVTVTIWRSRAFAASSARGIPGCCPPHHLAQAHLGIIAAFGAAEVLRALIA